MLVQSQPVARVVTIMHNALARSRMVIDLLVIHRGQCMLLCIEFVDLERVSQNLMFKTHSTYCGNNFALKYALQLLGHAH